MSFEAASPVVSAFKRLSELRRSKQRKELLSSGVVILHSRCRSLSLGFNTILSCAGNPQKSYPSKKENAEAAPFHSPFEGTINLQMAAKESMSTEPPTHKGFLTIFQEESRLGAWNRRWCSVQDNKIYYWLYPEDEINQNKAPHGEIDLRHCKSEKVSVASRLECARPNTFVLVTQTTSKPGDRCSIITETNNNMTQTKYLLSADSREERKEWIDVLNQCLLIVTSWNTK